MKHKVYITPSPVFIPGTAERILGELGVGPIARDSQNRIVAHLTQAQIDLWGIKGGAHRLELAPEVEPEPVPAAASEPEPEPPFTPSIIIESATGEKKVVSIDQNPVPQALQPDTSKLEPTKDA